MDTEETPHTLLKSQVPSLAKALLNQIKSSKTSPVVLQSGFSMLYTLHTALPGSLSQQTPQILTISKSVLSLVFEFQAALHLSCLLFLSLLFSIHSPSSFQASLPTFTPALLQLVKEGSLRNPSAYSRPSLLCLHLSIKERGMGGRGVRPSAFEIQQPRYGR
jgi:cullin-associated NEDD8-dissociated protein 1